jgi:DNA-binding IscR family transcriptional regulator
MQISTKFTIAIHLLAAVEYFGKTEKVTSAFLAGSIGCHPVIVRNIMLALQSAGLIEAKRGTGGIRINRPLKEITFLDVYQAVETGSDKNLFNFHENPNPKCPVGSHIHDALDGQLHEIQERFEEELGRHSVGDVYLIIDKEAAGTK